MVAAALMGQVMELDGAVNTASFIVDVDQAMDTTLPPGGHYFVIMQ